MRGTGKSYSSQMPRDEYRKEECCVERKSQCEWHQIGEIVRNEGRYWVQKDAYETDQTSNYIWGRNVGFNEATIKLVNVNDMRMLRWM